MPEETRRLLVGALDGNARAREDLLDRVHARLELWVAARLSRSLRAKVEPEDVVQETLLAVHQGLDSFDGNSDRAFLAWMFAIAENRIRDLVDHFGAKKRQLPEPVRRPQTTPSYALARKEMTARVREALEGLSEPHRRVIQLRRFEERTFHEIAPAMERSENAVRILYFRALRSLKEGLKRTGTLSAWGGKWNRF